MLSAEMAAKKAEITPALLLCQSLLAVRYAGKTTNELKNVAVKSCASSSGMPVNRINVETKKWKPGGVTSGSPPMWYGFHSGSFPWSRIRFMTLPCSPMSELGGYSLWKTTASLKSSAKPNNASMSKVLLCLVVDHRGTNVNFFLLLNWMRFIAFPFPSQALKRTTQFTKQHSHCGSLTASNLGCNFKYKSCRFAVSQKRRLIAMGAPNLTRKVEAIKVRKKTISQLVSEMAKTAYQGRKLAEAVELWERMVNEEDLVIILGLAGSMSTAGQWTIVNWVIENRFVDVIVSTGANISEDIIDAMGFGYWQATSKVDDEELLKADINRYYDVYGKETDYRKMEELLTEFLLTLKANHPYSSMEILHLLGKWLHKRNIESIAAVAAENGVPIFSPALLDSAYGEAVLMAKNKGHNLIVDQVKEFDQFVSIGERTKDTAVIYVGGGVPKDFTQLLAISISPKTMDQEVPGREENLRKSLQEYYYPHKYAIQITTDSPQWGGLSGCTLEEAKSWGKVSGKGRDVTCYCDATIALPIIAHALGERVIGDARRKRAPDFSWLLPES